MGKVGIKEEYLLMFLFPKITMLLYESKQYIMFLKSQKEERRVSNLLFMDESNISVN